ncbi:MULTISPECIES: phage tail protein [Photorhabdus]|uniref:Phage minor tail protein M n=3 Tax=Photorhabdus asymbiotica TaxID=291112 RepID=C7BU99_PHOAA|nr:phage tail protein [Photorhabdus asymbiotica]RKS53962.1 phage-related protein [Photorhabdus asymbiotica]RKS53974.1 phage-related protein [Photorhabdus asymbiotica]CAQ86510.1 putative phage minor tail protein M [Photorhabdus asymbiotica]
MSRKAFTWHPKFDSQKEMTPSVTMLSFGEGYEQRVTTGLNWRRQSWSLEFEGSWNEVRQIEDFLYDRGGIESFNWTSPEKDNFVVVCDKYQVKRGRGVSTLTATFRQVFE